VGSSATCITKNPSRRPNEAWKAFAAYRSAGLRKMVAEVMEKTGLTKLAEIAEALNLRGIKTNRGSQFTPTHIHRLLKAA
jgi:Recombinase